MVFIKHFSIFTFIEWLIYLNLTLVSLFLTWEVFMKYKSLDSNFKKREANITSYPTTIICFSPLIDDMVYGQNFTILKYPDQSSVQTLNDDQVTLSIGENEKHSTNLRVILTTYNGYCYKIISTEKANARSYHYFGIKFFEDIPEQKLPIVMVYFTTEANSYGILRSYWVDGEASILRLGTNHKLVEFGLKEERQIFLKEKSNCRDQPFYHCYGSALLKYGFKNCTIKCLSHSLPEEIVTSNNTLPVCQLQSPEMKCAKKVAKNIRKKVLNSNQCPSKPCQSISYVGEAGTEEISNERLYKRNFAYFFSPPKTVAISEEYLIYDFVGMLGSIGGTLGMFIGFSFFGALSFLLNQMKTFLEYFKDIKKPRTKSHQKVTCKVEHGLTVKCDPNFYDQQAYLKRFIKSQCKIVLEEYDLIKRMENSEEKIAELEITAEKSSRILGMVSSRKQKI